MSEEQQQPIRAEIIDTGDERIVSAQIVIDAPPEVIFDIVIQPRRHAEIDGSRTVQGVIKGPERLALGDTFKVRMRIRINYWVTNTVLEFEPNRRITWAKESVPIHIVECGQELQIGTSLVRGHLRGRAQRPEGELEEVRLINGEREVRATQPVEAGARGLGRVARMGREYAGHPLVESRQAARAHRAQQVVLVGEVVVGGARRHLEGLGDTAQGHVVGSLQAHLGQGLLDHRLGERPVVVVPRHDTSSGRIEY